MRHGVKLDGKKRRKQERMETEKRPSCTNTSARVQGAAMNVDGSIRETVSN